MRLRFEKVHGLGNDFVLLDLRRGGSVLDPETAAWLCDRRRGIGADGVLHLLPAQGDADLALIIQNADGSVPEMCGNGLRCVVEVVRDGVPGGPVRVETGAGPREGWVEDDGSVRVTLGRGRVVDRAVPVELGPPPTGTPPADPAMTGVAADLGNPHLVLWLDRPEHRAASLEALADDFGPVLERHPRFPDRVNVGFARPTHGAIDLVVYERGSGRTEACGTGAAAAALAARATGRWTAPGPIPVRLPGGPLRVEVPDSDEGQIELIGPTARVFEGEIALDRSPSSP